MNNTSTVTLSGVIGEDAGSRTLGVAGNGTLALPNAGYFSGGFTLSPFTGPGLLASFSGSTFAPGTLNNSDLNFAPIYQRLDPVVSYPNFAGPFTAGNSAALPNPSVTGAAQTIQWNGYLNVVNAGSYTLPNSECQQQRLVDRRSPCYQRRRNAPSTRRCAPVTVTLSAGLHAIRLVTSAE